MAPSLKCFSKFFFKKKKNNYFLQTSDEEEEEEEAKPAASQRASSTAATARPQTSQSAYTEPRPRSREEARAREEAKTRDDARNAYAASSYRSNPSAGGSFERDESPKYGRVRSSATTATVPEPDYSSR